MAYNKPVRGAPQASSKLRNKAGAWKMQMQREQELSKAKTKESRAAIVKKYNRKASGTPAILEGLRLKRKRK